MMMVLTTTTAALAQQSPVAADEAPTQPQWIGMVIGLVLVAGVLVASFISSKRGHQD